MTKALYRKYRSKTLSEVVGQDHITSVLSSAIKKGRIAHAYLLTGPRGVGKTSIARILAHEINNIPYSEETQHLDIIEIDAASNNGVDDVRDLRDKAQVAPVSATRKVYIIDEVHMLSKAAFNALLKTLEEPPEHIVFILATTDVDKLPATIISRVQQFQFRAIHPDAAATHLASIAKAEKIQIDDDALRIVAERGRGSFRDSISMLDQLASIAGDEPISRTDVERILGLAPQDVVESLIHLYKAHDHKAIISQLTAVEASGTAAKVLTDQLVQHIRLNITEHMECLSLLDDLTEVERSAYPSIKLLTVLTKPSAQALQSPQRPKSVATVATPAPIVASTPAPAPKQSPAKQVADTPTTPKAAPTVTEIPDEPSVSEVPQPTEDARIEELDWAALIETTRQHFVAVYSVVSKCSYVLVEGRLVLYTINPFYKKKLDDPRHRINLAKALEMIGHPGVSIETIGTPPPPKDSTLAAIAGIMGGGEEVSLEEQPA